MKLHIYIYIYTSHVLSIPSTSDGGTDGGRTDGRGRVGPPEACEASHPFLFIDMCSMYLLHCVGKLLPNTLIPKVNMPKRNAPKNPPNHLPNNLQHCIWNHHLKRFQTSSKNHLPQATPKVRRNCITNIQIPKILPNIRMVFSYNTASTTLCVHYCKHLKFVAWRPDRRIRA